MPQPWKDIWKSKEVASTPREMEEQEEEEEAFLPASPKSKQELLNNTSKRNGLSHSSRAALPWMISTVVLAGLLTACLINRFDSESFYAPSSPRGDDALSTDLLDARRAIVYERQRYTGELKFDTESKRVVRVLDSEIEYFGEPSDEIEEAWETMLRYEFPMLYADEVPDGLDKTNRLEDKHFHFEPDLFHNLHCLNEIRKEASKTLYPASVYYQKSESEQKAFLERFGPGWSHNHLEHCMDRIRQALICHGDLTPSIMHRYDGLSFELYHTDERLCRKWEPIRKWVDERAGRDNQTKIVDAEIKSKIF